MLHIPPPEPERPLLLVHVMAWFQADQSELGWHWRMNKTTDQVRTANKVASHFQPLIGPYDSADPKTVKLHIDWIKAAGFDGILIDYYGDQDIYDYRAIHTRTQAIFAEATRQNLKIGVVYEDQSVGNPIKNNVIDKLLAPQYATKAGQALKPFINQPNWLKKDGVPLILCFGPQFFDKSLWDAFRSSTGKINLVSLHHKTSDAQGAFDWPLPNKGIQAQSDWATTTNSEPLRIPVAFPRFQDYYKEGGQTPFPVIPDDLGETYTKTLTQAIKLNPFAVQVATWNDWQEGTQIEPSTQFKFRDLLATQKARKSIDPTFQADKNAFQAALDTYNKSKQ